MQEIKAAVDFLVDLILKRAIIIDSDESPDRSRFVLLDDGHLLREAYAARVIRNQLGRVTPPPPSNAIEKTKLKKFHKSLVKVLRSRFEKVWHKEKPERGQAFRCIRINGNSPVEPNIKEAADMVGIPYPDLNFNELELSLWVDPYLVSARIGEDGYPFDVMKFTD